jgi:hypothetical protein
VLLYTVADGVSVASNIQAIHDAKEMLPTKYVIWSASFYVCLASSGDLLDTLMTYIVTCVLTCVGGSDIIFGMWLPTPRWSVGIIYNEAIQRESGLN